MKNTSKKFWLMGIICICLMILTIQSIWVFNDTIYFANELVQRDVDFISLGEGNKALHDKITFYSSIGEKTVILELLFISCLAIACTFFLYTHKKSGEKENNSNKSIHADPDSVPERSE